MSALLLAAALQVPPHAEWHHDGWVRGVAFHPDGARAATAAWDDQVRVWRIGSGEPLFQYAHDADANAVAFSADGRWLASGGDDGTVRLFDLESGALARRWTFGGAWIMAVAFAPRGLRLAATDTLGKLRLWDSPGADGGDPRQTDAHATPAYGLAFSADGSRVATTAWDRTVRLWDPATGDRAAEFTTDQDSDCVAFAPDAPIVAAGCGGGHVHVWNYELGEPIGRLDAHEAPVMALAFHPRGAFLVSAGRDGAVRVWDLANRRMAQELKDHGDHVLGAAVSADGRWLVTGGYDRRALLWDFDALRRPQ